MYIYQPNSVHLPTELGINRIIPNSQQFTENELKRFDSRTIFFDVFLDSRQRKLRALGPRLLNLKSKILPLKVYVDDQAITFRLDEVDRLVFFESQKLPTNLNENFSVRFEFKTFFRTMELNLSESKTWERESKDSHLTITTLQKDNYIEWIEDWVKWHSRLFGVKRLIFYDNGSSNRDQLLRRLSHLEDEVKVIYVDWDFPYGLLQYECAQPGSLNHARLAFPIRNSYCINLDIDEFLVLPKDKNLVEYLDQKLANSALGAVIFSQYLVPNIIQPQAEDIPRFHQFIYRFKHFGKPSRNHTWSEVMRMKYIYHFDRIGYNGAHRTMSDKNKLFAKRYSILHKLNFYFKKCLREPFRYILLRHIPKPKIDACHASKDELYFFHFLGLNTGWRTKQKPPLEKFNDEIHIEEPLIHQLAEKANLVAPVSQNKNY